jgi:hypothetical protein
VFLIVASLLRLPAGKMILAWLQSSSESMDKLKNLTNTAPTMEMLLTPVNAARTINVFTAVINSVNSTLVWYLQAKLEATQVEHMTPLHKGRFFSLSEISDNGESDWQWQTL